MPRVWVYVWDHQRSGENACWGHSSLQVEFGPYISWWPSLEERDYSVDKNKSPILAGLMKKFIGTTNVYKVKHSCASSLVEDVMLEQRQPEAQIEVATGVLNPASIKKWWRGYQYEAASYHVIKKNCSTTVIRALRAGGSDKHVAGIQGPDFLSKRKGWEPTDILAYMRKMNKRLGDEKVKFLTPQLNSPREGTGVTMCPDHTTEPLFGCRQC